MHRFLSLGIIILLLNSCAAPRFSGPPSATLKDFVTARTDCYAKLRGSDKGGPVVNCNAFQACLMSKDFMVDPNGKWDPNELGIGVSCNKW